ncbi:LOW QUALITY PROTEIN: hypothetical protein PanWU01x14_244810, partial [Parasponia andersonii]
SFIINSPCFLIEIIGYIILIRDTLRCVVPLNAKGTYFLKLRSITN